MLLPRYHKLIQIELTNACPFECCHCSRFVGHHTKPFFMTVSEVEKALDSLQGYPGHIGIMGGEPTLHPDFEKICKLLQKYVPVKARRELWTSGANWKKYEKLINETFYKELIAFNDHSDPMHCWHQPLQVAIEEVFNGNFHMGPDRKEKDQQLMNKIIDNCWVNLRWSASVTPMGAYFCEVAAARAMLLKGPKGLPVEWEWWKRDEDAFAYQREELCRRCSACLPFPVRANSYQAYDDVSQGMLQLLSKLDSPKCAQGRCKCVDIQALRDYYKGHSFTPEEEYLKRGGFKDFPDWTPWIYRPIESKKHEPDGTELRPSEVVKMQKGTGNENAPSKAP